MKDRSTFSLIGDRYLDTQHDAEYIQRLENELSRRGVVGVKRLAYEYVAASGLWWNFLWLDWVGLDEREVRIGWISNLVVFGVLSLIAWFYFGLLGAIATFLILHGLTMWMALEARAGSRAKDQ
jgi:hypothetical protein